MCYSASPLGTRMEEEHSLRLRAASTPRRARLEDAGPLTQLFTRAFLNDPVMDWLARSGPKRASGAEAFFFRILQKRAIPAGEVWMSNDGAACAIWLPPGIPVWPVGAFEQLKVLPLFVQLCGYGRLMRGAAISGAMEKAHPHEKHLFVFYGRRSTFSGYGAGIGDPRCDAQAHR